jgi:hypothetical protein
MEIERNKLAISLTTPVSVVTFRVDNEMSTEHG